MSIELSVEEVRALGRAVTDRATATEGLGPRLADEGEVDGPLRAPVAQLLDDHVALATALAAELHRLGATVTGIADSWVAMDAALLPGRPVR